MTEEDEEFNRIEREAKQRMEAVSAALDKKAENARELGLDYEPVQRTWVSLTDEEVLALEETTTCTKDESWLRNLTRAIEAKLKEKNS